MLDFPNSIEHNDAHFFRCTVSSKKSQSFTEIAFVVQYGLIKVGSSLVPFANKFPKNTKLYKLMTTKPGEGA